MTKTIKTGILAGALVLTGSLSASMLSDALENAAKASNNANTQSQQHLAENGGSHLQGTSMVQVETMVTKVMQNRGFVNIHTEADGSGSGGQGRRVIGERTDGKDVGGQVANNVLTNMMGGDRGKIVGSTHVALTAFIHRGWADDGQADGNFIVLGLDGEDCDLQQNGSYVNCRKWLQDRKDRFKSDVIGMLSPKPAAKKAAAKK